MFDDDIRVVGRAGIDAGIARTRGSSRRRTATSGDDESQCRAGPDEAIAHVGFLQAVNHPERAAESRPPGSFRAVARGRVAGVGVQVSWLADRRPSLPSRGVSPQWRLSDWDSPLTVARQLRFRTGFPWYPQKA